MIALNPLTWAVVAYAIAALNIIFGLWLKTIVFSTVTFLFIMVMSSGSRRSVWLNGSLALLVATGAGIASRNMVW